MANALIDAVKENEAPLVKELIGRGVDVNGADGWGCTALWWASMNGFAECAKLLLEANADMGDRMADNTPLHMASNFGRAECVKVRFDLFVLWMKKNNLTFVGAAPHRLEGQRECQNKRW